MNNFDFRVQHFTWCIKMYQRRWHCIGPTDFFWNLLRPLPMYSIITFHHFTVIIKHTKFDIRKKLCDRVDEGNVSFFYCWVGCKQTHRLFKLVALLHATFFVHLIDIETILRVGTIINYNARIFQCLRLRQNRFSE